MLVFPLPPAEPLGECVQGAERGFGWNSGSRAPEDQAGSDTALGPGTQPRTGLGRGGFRREFSGGFEQVPLGPWPRFPCFKVQDWTHEFALGSGQSLVWTECPWYSLAHEAGSGRGMGCPTKAGPVMGFSFKGHTWAWVCPPFDKSRQFRPQAFLLPGKSGWQAPGVWPI